MHRDSYGSKPLLLLLVLMLLLLQRLVLLLYAGTVHLVDSHETLTIQPVRPHELVDLFFCGRQSNIFQYPYDTVVFTLKNIFPDGQE